MIGIYSITNIINSKCYVGQSVDISRRFSQHRSNLNKNKHVNRHLQYAWNKYGENNFKFDVLEICKAEDLNEKEKYWIDYCNSYNNGYNLDYGGDGIPGYKHTEIEISKMRKANNPLVVLQFDLNFKLIDRYEGGIVHAKKKYGYTKECIKRCCEHKGKLTYKDSYWVYEIEYENENFSWQKYLDQIPICNINKNKQCVTSRKIQQYDLDFNLVRSWNNINELCLNGFNKNTIITICNKRKNKKLYKGYIWTYEDYDFSDEYFNDVKAISTYNPLSKPVLSYDIIRCKTVLYESISKASESVKIDSACISYAIKNKSISAGYFWSLENDKWFFKCNKNELLKKYNCYLQHKKNKIAKCNAKHEVISIYSSMSEAATSNNYPISSISKAVHKKCLYKDCYWRYI